MIALWQIEPGALSLEPDIITAETMNTADTTPIINIHNNDDDDGQNPSVSFNKGKSCWKRKSTVFVFVLCGVPLFIFFVLSSVLAVLLSVEMWSKYDVCSTNGCVKAAGAILAAMNWSADPCDDFYQFACGGYQLRQSIPAGQNKLTQFAKIDNVIQKELRAVLESVPPPTEPPSHTKARRYYQSCMDKERIKKTGVTSMKTMVEKMGGFYLHPDEEFPSDWTFNDMLKKRNAYTLSSFFHLSIGPDDMNVLVNSIQLDQGGLGLGSDTRDYYVNKTLSEDEVMVAFTDMLESFSVTIMGREKVTRQAIVDVIKLEQNIANIQQSKAEQRDISAIYNKVNISWLQQNAGFIDWHLLFSDLFAPVDITIDANEPAILYSVPFFKRITPLINSYVETPEGRRILQNYNVLQAVIEYAPKFGDSFKRAFDTFMSVFVGKRGSQETWQICVADTDSNVGYPLGAMYANEYFSPDDRGRALFVMSEIVSSFKNRIRQVPWMDTETKEKALEKIDALVYDVGYPEWLHNTTYMDTRYEKLQVSNDYTWNQFSAFKYTNQRLLMTLRKDPDKTRWLMTPQTVNAYYEPTQNKFVVPAGILNIPFFFAAPGVPAALNFGAIGSVTGHEITHGFDDQGSQYDKYGNLKNWWNQKTLSEFGNHTKCLIDQYSSYSVDGQNLRGDQTLGENIADNGGVKTSYQAYEKALVDGKVHGATRLVGINLQPEQLFFVGYTQAWCSIFTPQAMEFQIRQNEHSPGPFRVRGPLSNSPEFAKAFNCPSTSPMNPVKKCSVW